MKTSRQPKHSFFVNDALVSCPACNGKHRPHTFDENCLKKKPPGKEKPLDKAGEIKMTPAPKRMTKKTAPADDPIAPKDTAKVLPEPSEPASGSKGPDRPSGIPEVIEVPPGLPKPADKKDPTVKTSLPLVLQRIHAKLESDVELYKLHLKHYHMSAEQFKRRTSALRIPAHIYDRYESMVKQCDTCQKSKVAPSRSRISGMRSEVFGELTFIDHGEAPVSPTSKLVFLLIYDGATTLTTAYPVESKGDKETVSCLLDYFETYQLMPKYIVADMAFMGQEMESFYNRKNIHPIALGPSTPWPNRAEAGVRLFKQQVDLMLKTIGDTPSLKDVTYRQLLRQACLARNSMVTFGGVSPIEMAFGRRPADVVGPDVQSPGELTAGIPAPEAATHALRHLAMKSYLEARQSADLRQDIASRLRLSDGPFVPGDKIYYWTEDKSKIKSDGSHGGKWIKGKILTAEGSMANIDLGTRVIKVNISKLRKDHNPLEDVQVPLDPLAMYLNTDADRVDPAKVLMARDAAQLSPEGISYSNSHWMPVTSGPIDFLELFSGSARLSQVAALSGLRVGTPVDFRTGFDLNRSLDRQRVMSIIEKQKPMFIFMAVECTAWSIMQNASDPEYRRKKQQKAMPMVEFCSAVAKYQIDHGRFFLIENPSTSSIWYTRSFTRLLNYHQAVTWDNLHMCAFGMKDPNGYYYYKPTSLMHNLDPKVIKPVFKRCPNLKQPGDAKAPSPRHFHQPVEGSASGHGSRTKLAQVYPYKFCQTLVDSLLLLGNPRALCTSTSLLCADFFTDLSEQELKGLALALSESVVSEFPCFLETDSSLLQTRPKRDAYLSDSLPVQDYHTRRALNKINSFPHATELDPSTLVLATDLYYLRRKYIPHMTFQKAFVCRGTFAWLREKIRTCPGVVILWKKRDPTRLWICDASTLSLDPLIAAHWSAIFFWNSDGSTPVAQPLRSRAENPSHPDAPMPPAPNAGPDEPSPALVPDVDMPPGDPDVPLDPHDLPPGPSDDPRPSGLPYDDPPDPSPSAHPGLPGHSVSDSPPDGPVVPVLPDAPVTPGITVPPTVPDVDMGLGGVKRNSAETSDDPPATKARPSQPTPPTGSRLGGDVSPTLPSRPVFQPSGPKFFRMDTPPDDEHDPEATSSGPPPLPITDDGPSASMPAPKPADKPEFQPSQPAATADEESDADDGEDDTVPYSTGSDRTVPYESDQSLISDLYVDELSWTFLTQEQKLCSNTASFSVPRYITGLPVDVLHTDSPGDLAWLTSHQAFKANVRRQKKRAYGDLSAEYSGITEEDRAFLTLWQTSDDKHAHLVGKKRKEASQQEQRELVKQFLDAKKAECQSWLDNDVYDLVDMRKLQVKNFVSGRWVLTVKRDKDGNFLKCKARWVLRGFEDRQKNTQQTDSPAASRSGFRCVSQLAANKRWDLYHMDLKTAFLQGEAYDTTRDVICQIPKEAGHPPYIGARLKRPAYGLNDAPRRWWNVVDKALLSYGLVPTRADRCTYVLYSEGKKNATATSSKGIEGSRPLTTIDEAVDFLMDPIARNNAQGRDVHGFVCLHVDDLYMGGDDHFVKQVPGNIRKDFNVGSEDKNDIMFVGQRIRWKECPKNGPYLSVDQKLAVDAVEEIKFDKHLKDDIPCTPQLHTAYRSVLGQLNWLQSRTQAHICYRFSRCASAAAKPTIGDVREINKVVRILKSNYIDSRHWPLRGNNRILGFPDASYRNNADKSSQRAHVIFIAEERHLPDPKGKTKPDGNSRGSIVDYESHKITTTTQSTTVAELAALMKCFGTCLFLRGLWADVAGEILPIHIRTDANNLVTTAQTTHLPEQKETHHLIQMLRHESNTGQLHDLSHVSSEYCLADPLTKHSAKPDQLVFSIETGQIVNADMHPPFRTLIKHKAFAATWCVQNLREPQKIETFLSETISEEIFLCFYGV